jgi:hypothetical protein
MARTYLKAHRLRVLAIGGATLLLITGPAAAESCLLHPAKLADAAVEGFKGRPSTLLDDYPNGGVVMTAAVRRLAGSAVETVPALVSLGKSAAVPQVVALGAGLAAAVNVCKLKRPDLAQRISDEVKQAQLPALFAAFAASLSSGHVVAMGAPEPLLLGRALVVELPQVKAPPREEPAIAPPPKKQQPVEERSIPRASFGNGGIVRTVVNPVSPAR